MHSLCALRFEYEDEYLQEQEEKREAREVAMAEAMVAGKSLAELGTPAINTVCHARVRGRLRQSLDFAETTENFTRWVEYQYCSAGLCPKRE